MEDENQVRRAPSVLGILHSSFWMVWRIGNAIINPNTSAPPRAGMGIAEYCPETHQLMADGPGKADFGPGERQRLAAGTGKADFGPGERQRLAAGTGKVDCGPGERQRLAIGTEIAISRPESSISSIRRTIIWLPGLSEAGQRAPGPEMKLWRTGTGLSLP